ncbi:MAG: PIN domain-containing protein [Chloroflexota bacterium]
MKKAIVLDANILFRAILGTKVPEQLNRYATRIDFFTPTFCYEELRKHIPKIAKAKNLPIEPFNEAIEKLEKVVLPLDKDIYSHREREAKDRIRERDINDWPIVALALRTCFKGVHFTPLKKDQEILESDFLDFLQNQNRKSPFLLTIVLIMSN